MRSSAGSQPFLVAAAFAVLAGFALSARAEVFFVTVPEKDVNPFHIAPDFNGGAWCTDRQHRTVDHLTGDVNGDGTADIIVVPPTESAMLAVPESIATAPNGNVVFTYNTTTLDGSPIDSRVGFFNVANPKGVSFVRMPATPGVAPSQDTCANADCPLTLTGDGTQAWVIEQNVDAVSLVGLTRPSIALFKLTPHTYPLAVAAAPDGSAYVAEYFGGTNGGIAKLSPAGGVVETRFPSFAGGDKPQRLAFNVFDNSLYIGTSADGIVAMSPSLQFSRTALPTSNTQMASLIAGPDGDLFWTGFGSKTLGQWAPPAGPMSQTPLADAPADVIVSGTTLYYVGFPPGSFDGNLHKGTLDPKARPHLKEVKTHSDNITPVGVGLVRITYTITLTNIGEGSTHGPLFIFDHVPLGDIVVAPSPCTVSDAPGEPSAVLTCPVAASLNPGESTSVTFTADVPLPAEGGSVRNICAFSGGGGGMGSSDYDVYVPAAARRRPARH